MKSFEDNDDERLIIAINLINFNEVIKSTLIDNYEIVNIALKILVICFRNYTNCLEIFVEQLWFDLINNFQRFPDNGFRHEYPTPDEMMDMPTVPIEASQVTRTLRISPDGIFRVA